MSEENQPTLDQRRARHAWDAVSRIASKPNEREGYQREAKRLPVRILTAGLGHALAFLDAKGKKANNALLQDVADWILNKRNDPENSTERPRPDALIEKITKENSVFLRVTTDEVLAYLQWLTRFAEAKLKTSSTDANG